MVEFVTITEETLDFGEANFFEIASKKAICEDGEKPFISLTRGYYKDGNEKRFTKAISFPNQDGIAEKVAKQLLEYAANWEK